MSGTVLLECRKLSSRGIEVSLFVGEVIQESSSGNLSRDQFCFSGRKFSGQCPCGLGDSRHRSALQIGQD